MKKEITAGTLMHFGNLPMNANVGVWWIWERFLCHQSVFCDWTESEYLKMSSELNFTFWTHACLFVLRFLLVSILWCSSWEYYTDTHFRPKLYHEFIFYLTSWLNKEKETTTKKRQEKFRADFLILWFSEKVIIKFIFCVGLSTTSSILKKPNKFLLNWVLMAVNESWLYDNQSLYLVPFE